MPRFRYDKDLDEVVEIRPQSNYFEEETKGPNVISDTMEGGVNGTRAMYREDKKHFDSKSTYRADVKAHGLAEVGNDLNMASFRPVVPKDYYGKRVKQAYEQFSSNHNGTADQVRAMEAQTAYRRRNG